METEESQVEAMETGEPVAYSALPASVEDIDGSEEDKVNPQMVSEYVNEIYAYMRQMEVRLAVKESYLEHLHAEQGKSPTASRDQLVTNYICRWRDD